ncbi:MAG TPA: hypothetical protein VLH38_03365 [Patescibacteria group bacterium]|nr:hypothetical protein [Patescibacteria group bacterium]
MCQNCHISHETAPFIEGANLPSESAAMFVALMQQLYRLMETIDKRINDQYQRQDRVMNRYFGEEKSAATHLKESARSLSSFTQTLESTVESLQEKVNAMNLAGEGELERVA